MFVALDENGVVVDGSLRTNELQTFLDRPKPALVASPSNDKTSQDLLSEAEALLRWGKPAELSDAIAKFKSFLAASPGHGPAEFALGVAYRQRFDSKFAEEDDFRNAVAAWGRALEIDPNQYIYRRRIQQYGPRLIKPYPFYDWIEQAKAEIKERGEEPVELSVELSGAEIAQPARSSPSAEATSADNPDPNGRILRDAALIETSAVVVPAAVKPGEAVRVHLSFTPQATAHWNNEAEPMLVWLETPSEWKVQQTLSQLPQPASPESNEVRHLEIEIKSSKRAKSQKLNGFALFYVCEELSGQCLYRRLDFEVNLELKNEN